jgi:hypothetical protein
MDGPLKLRVSRALDDEAERFEFVGQLLRRLAPTGTGAAAGAH